MVASFFTTLPGLSAKRITLWAMCGSVMYWIPGIFSLHSFLGEAIYGHLMYPYA